MQGKQMGSLFMLLILAGTTGAFADGSAEQLAKRISLVQLEYDTARRALTGTINQSFSIDYDSLHLRYQDHERDYRQRLAIVEKIEDRDMKQAEMEKLKAEFTSPEYFRYAEARLYLDNELERDHVLRARSLQAYEEILDDLITQDPLLDHFFRSPEFRKDRGLILKRVVWEFQPGVSATTVPINAYSVFADRARTPFLIKLFPVAFTSVVSLRSILIHELNHVLLYTETPAMGMEQLSSLDEKVPLKPIPNLYSMFFSLRHGKTPYYQYHLLHEYYSFKAQIVYDDMAPPDPYFRLSAKARKNIEDLCEWAYSELSGWNKEFVKKHPDPPMTSIIQRFTQSITVKTPQ